MSIGRPKLVLWTTTNEFKLMKLDNGKQAAGCLKCNKILKNTAMKRLKQHRNICKIPHQQNSDLENDYCSFSRNDSSSEQESEPEEIKPKLLKSVGNKRKYSTEKIGQLQFEPIMVQSDPLQSIALQLRENEDLDISVAEFFFGCNIPFSVIESDHFRNLLFTLRPGYESMSKETLSTVLLNKVYQKSYQPLCEKDAVLLIDSWKHNSNSSKNVVSMIHFGKGKSQFLNAWELVGTRETGYLSTIIEESINIAKTRFGSDIYAIVSDNPSSIVKLETKMNVWHSRCVSYTAKLLVKDIVPQGISAKVTKIINEFETQGINFLTSTDRKWNTYSDTLESVLEHLTYMVGLASSELEGNIKTDVKAILFEDDFRSQLEHNIKIFRPIRQLVQVCESSEATIADAVHEWISLELPMELIEYEQLLDKLKRIATNKYGLAAYYLHPTYRGQGLKNEDLDTVECFLLDLLDAAGLDELQSFKNNDGVFRKLNWKEGISAETYWGIAERNNPNLARLAKKLLRIPASIGQLDRLFSSWSFVHSSERNKLSVDNANKLMSVYYYLKLKDTNSSTDY